MRTSSLRRCAALVAVLSCASVASAQITLSANANPASAQPGGVVAITGTGFSGTIVAANVHVTITPPAGNGSPVTVTANTITNTTASSRTAQFIVPAALTTSVPLACKVSLSATTSTSVVLTSASPGANLTVNPPPTVLSVSPGASQLGAAAALTVTGNYTHFTSNTAVSLQGPGALGATTISQTGATTYNPATPNQVIANFNIPAGDPPGSYTVIAKTGTETASLVGGFLIATAGPFSLSSIVPNTIAAGQGATVSVVGVNTHFVQGTTVAAFGDGIHPGTVTVASATQATFPITTDAIAVLGSRTLTMTTGGEFATGTFTLTGNGSSLTTVGTTLPALCASACSGAQGANATLALTGLGTHWVQAGTNVSVGGSINVGNITVTSPTSLTVNISIGPGVALGSYPVTATTNGEIVTKASAFSVTAATPYLSNVAPNAGVQGAVNLPVVFTGVFTSFNVGSISANFGPNIAVNSVAPNGGSATSATANITIASTAIAGGRTGTLSSNGTNYNFTFTVTASNAALTGVTPNSGLQSSSVALQVTSTNTHWVQGLTSAAMGAGIVVNRVIVNAGTPTNAEVDITIPANAPLGATSLTMSAGGEIVTLSNAFTVLPYTPSLTLAPSSGMIPVAPATSNPVNVNFSGNFTHFALNQTIAAIDGNGVAITNFIVINKWQATAQFAITAPASLAAPVLPCNNTYGGNHIVTLETPLTSGSEIVHAGFCVTSTPAVLTSISPYHSPEPVNNLTVTITGQYTHFEQGITTVGFGPNITVVPGSVNVIGAAGGTQTVTATINIAANAVLGWRPVFVNTVDPGHSPPINEQLTIGFAIDPPATASLVSVTPNTGIQGQSLSVQIAGNLTNWAANDTVAIFGTGITVNSLTIAGTASATALISIDPVNAPAGGSSVTMVTQLASGNEEVVSGPLFSVTKGIAAIDHLGTGCGDNYVAANSCQQHQLTLHQGDITPLFNVYGTNTHWLAGETTLNFGPDIAVSQLVVQSPTWIQCQIAVSYNAAIGYRGVTAVTNAENAPSFSDALNILALQPVGVTIDTHSAPQGTTFDILVNGTSTHWTSAAGPPNNTTASFGNNNGVNVTGITVTSQTQMTLHVQVLGTAYVGPYTLTITTTGLPVTLLTPEGTEQIVLNNTLGIGPGAAIIMHVVPTSGTQNSSAQIAVTGQNTSFLTGATTASFSTGGCNPATPAGINVSSVTAASPTSATLAIAVSAIAPTGYQTLCMYTLGESVSYSSAFQVLPGNPTLNEVSPVTGQQGQTLNTVTILGQFTNWQPGVTTVTFGQGISVQNLTITGPASATATLVIDGTAYTGPRTTTVTTGNEVVNGNFFSVTASAAIISTISPTIANQGQHILMTINGDFTHWSQELTQFSISGGGYDIKVNGVVINSATQAVADLSILTISGNAGLGTRTVSMSTVGETVTLQSALLITGGVASIVSISPNYGTRGDLNDNVHIVGQFTLWDSTTVVDFGDPAITVQPSSTVNDNFNITAVINVGAGATLGVHNVTVRTGVSPNFSVQLGQYTVYDPVAPPAPYISYEYPSVALVGQTLAVNLSGAYTNWLPGQTTANFGAGILVNNFDVTGINTATANITIEAPVPGNPAQPGASVGPRTVTITTGSQGLTTTFYVTVGTPAITVVDTNTAIQGETRLLDLVGQYTTWTAAGLNPTVFTFCAGVTSVSNVQIFGPTAARVQVTVGPEASVGYCPVTATTGAEVAQLGGGGYFAITPSTATITSVSPNTELQNTSIPLSVNVVGFATNWDGTTTFSFGSGVTVATKNVIDVTHATLTLTTDLYATPGYRSLIATTGGEHATLNNAFVVQPGTPILLSTTNGSNQQQAEINLLILGQYTAWTGANTTVAFPNGGLTGLSVNVTGPQSITVTGSVLALAYPGCGPVVVTTTGQVPPVLTLYNAFCIIPGPAAVTGLSPNNLGQGQRLAIPPGVLITGTNTNWLPGVTVATFGPGISVNNLTINGPTSATADITVAANATPEANTVTLTTAGETARDLSGFTIVAATPVILDVFPNSGTQGQTNVDVCVTAAFTHFVEGNTTATFGPGINATSVKIAGPNACGAPYDGTHADVTISIAPTAHTTPGNTNHVQLTTNLATIPPTQEIAVWQNSSATDYNFSIGAGGASISSATPTSPVTVHQNDTDDTIVITGLGTHFDATSIVTFCTGITPVLTTPSGLLSLTVIVNVSQSATLGACSVTVTTGGEIAIGNNLFNVLAGVPVVTGLNPVSAHQNDSNVNVTVSGLFTHFVQNTTTASFGAGIVVNGFVTVGGPTAATVNITVSPTAALGTRTVTLTTGLEQASLAGVFTVVAGLPQVSSINPVSGAQNSTQTVTVNGLYTNFDATSVVTFAGGNVNAGVPQINGPLQLTVSVTVAPGATATARTITVTTPDKGEVASLANAFTVLPGAPAIITISPNEAVPGTNSLSVNITGLFTNFVLNNTTAKFGAQISVGGAAQGAYGPILVTGPTTATAIISIDPAAPAPLGHDVTVKDPTESPTSTNGFTVQTTSPTAPTIISTSPTSSATGVPLNTSYTVVFSGPINGLTVASTNVALSPTGCNANGVPANLNVDASGRILTIAPTAVLAVETQYWFTLNDGSAPFVKDASPAANTLGNACYAFTTGFAPSSTGPAFIGANILNGDPSVGTNVTPTFGFDKPIDSATQPAGLTIFAGATPVAGIWGYNATYTQATFTPAGGFTPSTSYTINLTAALTDTVGNALVNPPAGGISFTTAAGADNTGPTLVSYTPPGGSATGENPTIRMVFSKEMNPLTLTLPGQYYLYRNTDGHTVLGTVVTASADLKTFTMILPGPLDPSTSYAWNCGQLKDQAGHTISPGPVSFTTGPAVDLTPPIVTEVSPPNTEPGVAVNSPIYILLSKPIDSTTVSNSSLALSPPVAGVVSLTDAGLIVTFKPAANLATSQTYTVNASGFADLDGNLVTPFSSTFTTSGSATPDTTHGTISEVPGSGATAVATNASAVFTFSKVYDPASVSNYNVRLYDSTSGTYINGNLTLNAAFTSVTFTPSALLEPGHQYCAYVGYHATIWDVADNSFSYIANQCFTTANGADITPPTVISVMPLNNATGIGPNNPVIVTFSKPMNTTTLSTQNVAIYKGIALYTTSFSTSFDATTVTFNAGNLPYNTTFTVVITPNVTDLAGNHLAAQFASSFTTIPAPDATNPFVTVTPTAMRPAPGATGVPVNATITLFISEPLNPATVPGALEISQNGVLITGPITYGSNNQVVVFTPSVNFQPGAHIGVFFTSAATDNSGNPLTNYQASFTVAPDLSATPAILLSTSPAQSVTGVPTTAVVDLQFSKPINPATVNAASFYLLKQDAGPQVGGTIQMLNNNTVLRFIPGAPLQGTAAGNSIYYRVHYENTLHDLPNGLPIGPSADNMFYFYVGLASDATPPHVTMVAPTNNAPNIGANTTIRVTFSEAIDPLTISASTLTVVSNAAHIPYNATFDSANTTLTIVPQAALPASSQVTVSLTAGIDDPSGNALVPYSSVFTTGPAPDFVLPTVISSSVNDNQTGVPLTSVFTLTYNKPIDTRTEVVGSTVWLHDNTAGFGDVPITLSFSPDGTQVTIQPQSLLAVNHSMYVQACYVQDLNGNTMTSCPSFSFTTALVAPVGGPQVTFVLPPSGFQVPTNFKPEIQFDRPVDLTSLGGITLQQAGNPVTFSTALSQYGLNILILTPNSLLPPNLPFTLTVTGVKDTGGNTMAGSVTRNFTTGPSIDLVSPVVSQYSPQNGEITGTHPVIRIFFNEPINPLPPTNGTWNLYNAVTGVHFPGAAIAASADLMSETITYPGNLDPNTQYCWGAALVYDLAGNYTSTGSPCFTTASGPDNTAPTVTSVTPPNGQPAVAVNALVQVVLSKPIDATTVTNSSLTLTPAAPASSSVSLSADGLTMTLSLGGSNLANTTGYTLNAGGFKDLNGNTVTPFSSTFTTSALIDNTAGTISLTSPAPGSGGVAVTSAITLTLNEAVAPDSVLPDTFVVYGNNNGNQRIPGMIAIGGGGSTLTFTPIGPLPSGTPIDIYAGYYVHLLDLAGNAFTSLFNATFTTASTPDTTPPTILSVTPTGGAANVGPNAVVTVIFSKALNYATLNSQNFTLFNGFTNLNASVAHSADNRTVTLTVTLPYSSTITVAVNTNVQDLDGNNLANPYSSTFTTETQPLTAVPAVMVVAGVSQMRPANGATGVPVNATITLYFTAPLNPATVPGAFHVEQNGALVVGGGVVTGADNRSAVWTGPGFPYNTYIQVFFSGATDISGNVVNNYSASFTTALNLTATPATLVSTSPANGAYSGSAVPTTSVVDLQFSKPIDPGTVNPGSFYILKQDGLPAVTGTIQMLANNTVLRFIPSAPLQGAALGNGPFYRVHYENTLHDSGGLPIAGSADNTTYFYVSTATDNTPPTVTSSAPDNGATGVGDNATVRFIFSEPMDTATINPTTVTLMNGATPIPFSLSFSGTAYTSVTLSPQAPLPDNATLTLALTSGITDPSNNALTPQSITFQTGNGADFSAPYVIYSSIDSSTPAVPVNSSFTLIFNKPLDRNAVSTQVSNSGNYSVWAPGVGPIPTTITVSPDGRTVTFVPAPNLIPSHSYTLYAESATDLNGNKQTDFSVTFITSAGTDSTPPQVIGSNPAAGATGAPLNPSIEAQFNEAVSATTLSQITLMTGATPVPFTASLIYADSTVRLTPANLLLPNITYTVVVQGVQDVAGNTMAGSYTFSFLTGTNFDVSATPNILSVIANGLPLSGANTNNIPDNPTVAISFDTPVEPASLTNNGGVQILLASNTSISYPLNIALSADRKTATVTLAPGTLAATTQYLIRVGYNYRIRDWAGNYNNGQYVSYPFTTQ